MGKSKKPSYSLIQQPELSIIDSGQVATHDEPAVKPFSEHHVLRQQPTSFIKKLWTGLFGAQTKSSAQEQAQTKSHTPGVPAKSGSKEQSHDRRGQHPNRRRRPSGNQQRSSANAAHPNENPNPQRRKQPHQAGQQGTKPTSTRNPANKRREPATAKDQEEK